MRFVVAASFVLLIGISIPNVAIAEAPYKITPDVIYGHKAGMALTFDVIRPNDANGAGVLFMMSGGWFSMWVPPELLLRPEASVLVPFNQLVEHGYTVFIVRHGSAPQFKVPEAVADVRRAVRYIRRNAATYGIDPNRIGVCGGSAGGHLSLMLGTTGDEGDGSAADAIDRASDRVAAVVAYCPPVDLRDWAGPDAKSRPQGIDLPALDFDAKLAESVSPLVHVTPDDAPTLLVHGDKDGLVKIDHSRQILAAFQQHQVPSELVVVEGAGHAFLGDAGRRASQALVGWFDKHLAADAEDEAADGK
jgi:acetyl esterase/lipase